MKSFSDLKEHSEEAKQLLQYIRDTKFTKQPTPEELAEEFSAGFRFNPIPHYDDYRLTTEKIMQFYNKEVDSKGNLFTLDDLLLAEQFELDNPTDWNKPNFFTGLQTMRKELDPRDFLDIRAKSAFPIRLSYTQAQIIEELTRAYRLNNFKTHIGRTMTDKELRSDIAVTMSQLSPEAFASFFFYHNKYIDNTSRTFADKNVPIVPFQKAFLRCNNLHMVLKISRQLGKSTVLQILAMWYVIMKEGFTGYFIGPQSQTNIEFFNEVYSEGGSTKLHPWLTEEFCHIEKRTTARHIHCRRKILNNQGEIVLSNVESKLKMGFARGDGRFVGTTNQGLFFDEYATFEKDPSGLVTPTIGSFRDYGFTVYASTVREKADNPMLTLLDRQDIRVFERNILSSQAIGKHSIREVNEFKNKCDTAAKWETEYLNIIPENPDSLITLQDITECSTIIDEKLEKFYRHKTRIPPKDKLLFKNRDIEKLKLVYDIEKFNIGVDWNGDNRGNNITVVAVCIPKTTKKKKNDDEDGGGIMKYEYVVVDSYRIYGQSATYDTIVTLYSLLKEYKVDKFYADGGYSMAYKTLMGSVSELQVDLDNNNVYSFIDDKAIFKNCALISFGMKIKTALVDNYKLSSSNTETVSKALTATLITLIKDRRLIWSKFEAHNFVVIPDYSDYIDDETGELLEEGESTYVENVRQFKDMKSTFRYACSRTLVNNNSVKFNAGSEWKTLTKNLFVNSSEPTFVDEIRRLSYKSDKGKYVFPASKVGGIDIQDDRVISLLMALYPSILEYEPSILGTLEKFVDKDQVKRDEIEKRLSEYAFMAASLMGIDSLVEMTDDNDESEYQLDNIFNEDEYYRF